MPEREILADVKGTKGVGKVLINIIGLISFLFGSLILVAVVCGMIGNLFMSTKPLFKRVKREEGVKELEGVREAEQH